jgi:hypothetical protein
MPAKSPRKKATPSAAARQAEAEDGFVVLEQCGVKLRLPVGGKLPLAAIDCFRAGDNYGGTKAMLGEKQWNLLVAAGATSDDLDELGGKLNASSGN